jgi:hypothetical protein
MRMGIRTRATTGDLEVLDRHGRVVIARSTTGVLLQPGVIAFPVGVDECLTILEVVSHGCRVA